MLHDHSPLLTMHTCQSRYFPFFFLPKWGQGFKYPQIPWGRVPSGIQLTTEVTKHNPLLISSLMNPNQKYSHDSHRKKACFGQ